MIKRLKASTACAAILALSACGGGGGVESTPPPPSAPTPVPTPPPTPPPPPTNFNTAEYRDSNGAVSSGAIKAWTSGSTGKGVKLAIIDTGINISSTEFAGRIDPASRDVAGARSLGDDDGHGSAVAATAAAARNDRHNVGIAFDATILAFRADQPGTCQSSDGCDFFDAAIADGVDAARANGARVINLSLGGSEPDAQLLAAMQRAVTAGIVLVISAGNDGEDPNKGANADPFALIPALRFPGQVIIAGSVGVRSDTNGTDLNQLSTFSNRAGAGAQSYLTALGFEVRTIDNKDVDYLYSGTSFSAPVITGAVALVAQAFPNMTGSQIVDLLFRTADDLGTAGTDDVFGRGRLNITRAFQPVGTASLAGTGVAVTASSTGSAMPEAAGDSGAQSTMGAIILDGYNRAFAINLAKGMNAARQRSPLRQGLAGQVQFNSANAGPMIIAMSVAKRPGGEGVFDVDRLGIGPDDARQSRLVAGSVIARLDDKTKAAFGFGESAKSIERRLGDFETGAFLIARDTAADPGFEARRAQGMGLRRDLGFAVLTATGERGSVWQDIRASGHDGRYRMDGFSLDGRLGGTLLSAGLTRLREEDTLLGGRLGDLYGASGSSTLFFDVSARQAFGEGWTATISGRRGWTEFANGRFQTSAYGLDIGRKGLFGEGDRFGFRVAQPLRVDTGGLAMVLPTSYDYATETPGTTISRMSFAPSGREIDAELSYSRMLGRAWIGGNLFGRRQPGHIATAKPDVGAAIRYSLSF